MQKKYPVIENIKVENDIGHFFCENDFIQFKLLKYVIEIDLNTICSQIYIFKVSHIAQRLSKKMLFQNLLLT